MSDTVNITDKPLVMAIDDDHSMLEWYKALADVLKIRLMTFRNPLQAMRVLEETKPNLMLLDLSMPGMDGGAFLRRLRNQGETFPVIIVTGQDRTVWRFYESLASAVIQKPAGFTTFRDHIEGLVAWTPA